MKFLMMLFVLASCASKPEQMTEKARNLEIYPRKPEGCSMVGKLVGKDEMGSREMATNKIMNQAEKFGATGVVIDQEVPNGKIMMVYASAYKCD